MIYIVCFALKRGFTDRFTTARKNGERRGCDVQIE